MQDLYTELFDALEDNNLIVINELLLQGVDANAKTNHGSALHMAARWGSQETIKLLLEYGANVHAQDFMQRTALHWAACKGTIEIIKLLLAAGADIHAQDYEGKTALHMVTNKNSLDLLLSYGADIKAQDDYGNTPLHAIASGENAERTDAPNLVKVVATLLERGADPHAVNNAYSTPLFDAISSADSENWINPQEDDPNIAIIKLLLAANANVNVQEKHNGWAPLHFIAYRNHARMIPLLLAHGADINIKNNTGETPLHMAVAQSNLKIVKLLLEAGAQVNVKDCNLITPLHIAVSFDSFERSKEEVRWTASKNERQYTLHPLPYEHENYKSCFEMHYGLKEVVTLLLEYGADRAAQNKDGKTPHMIALEKGHSEIAQMLEEYEKKLQ
ncbi:MAG: ankyrin repeat domain-containing protein [Candidatus Babeliales bacterium]